jgi:hypothetical protein
MLFFSWRWNSFLPFNLIAKSKLFAK